MSTRIPRTSVRARVAPGDLSQWHQLQFAWTAGNNNHPQQLQFDWSAFETMPQGNHRRIDVKGTAPRERSEDGVVPATSWAWLAGFLDGEGSIQLLRKTASVTANMTCNITHAQTAQHIVSLLTAAGITTSMHQYAQPNPRHRPYFHIVVGRLDSLHHLAEVMLPYAVTKHGQWDAMRAFTASRLDKVHLDQVGRVRRGGGRRGKLSWGQTVPYTDDENIWIERVQSLNRRGAAAIAHPVVGSVPVILEQPIALQLAWLAGLYDAEGTVSFSHQRSSVQRNGFTYNPNIAIQMADAETIETGARILDSVLVQARIHHYAEDDPTRHRDGHHLKVAALQTVRMLVSLIKPYAYTKADRWRLMGAYVESRSDQFVASGSLRRGHRNRLLTDQEIEIAEELRRMNREGT